jgi:hypothetical protein
MGNGMSSMIAELEEQEEKILLGQVPTCYFMKENNEITHKEFIETMMDLIKFMQIYHLLLFIYKWKLYLK